MKLITTLIFLGGCGYGLYWINENHPELKSQALDLINSKSYMSLEARYKPEHIFEKEQLKPLKSNLDSYSAPQTAFHPHLLMEVKFTNPSGDSQEGVMIWDLVDGEMVIDTKTWKKTHGFSDCINSTANKFEYQIIAAIARNNGKLNAKDLGEMMDLDPNILNRCIDKALRKNLIIKQGNYFRIHLNHPILNISPQTTLSGPLGTKKTKNCFSLDKNYSVTQIKSAAESFFGPRFSIRTAKEVYVPVYCIAIQNEDGSRQTTLWNAYNGKRMSRSSLIEW